MVRHRIEQSEAIKKKKKAKTTIGDDYGIKLPDEDQVHEGRSDSDVESGGSHSMKKSKPDNLEKLKKMVNNKMEGKKTGFLPGLNVK